MPIETTLIILFSVATAAAITARRLKIPFALNSVVFLLIGFEVSPSALLAAWPEILLAFVVVVVARALVVYGVGGLLNRTTERIPSNWLAVMTWGGLRGALSMVLALALPFDFPNRELLITLTFGVVLLSILVQGLTMQPLLRRVGLALHGDSA